MRKDDMHERLTSTNCLKNYICANYFGKRNGDYWMLGQDVDKSIDAQKLFRKFKMRGFSYQLITGFELGWPQVRPDINLKISLQTSMSLFYPQKIRNKLRRMYSGHLRVNGNPSIGYLLGKTNHLGWFVFIVQSDLMFNQTTVIRDHFRGWRKILFHELLTMAKGRTENIYLTRSEDVWKSCKPKSRPQKIPDSWVSIYDKTAVEFEMKPVSLNEAIDIQIIDGEESLYTNQFYKLKI